MSNISMVHTCFRKLIQLNHFEEDLGSMKGSIDVNVGLKESGHAAKILDISSETLEFSQG